MYKIRLWLNAGRICTIAAFIIMALIIADGVMLHMAERACSIQNDPGVHHDWDAVLDTNNI